MNDFQKSQLDLAINVIIRYEEKLISLDSFIQNLEAIMNHLVLDKYVIFSDALAELEITNSFLIEGKR